jgi:hypothetical protein
MQQQNKPNDQLITSHHPDTANKSEMGREQPHHEANHNEAHSSTAQRGKQPLQTGTERLNNK